MKEEKNFNPDETTNCESPLMDHRKSRYPFCIVWTPIPILTWLFPFLGHMGIALSSGIIRDFAGPYYVSEDDMAFGKPTKYWQLHPDKVRGGRNGFDSAITEASEIYKGRMHNLFCDNCHSHVAYALNLMNYNGSSSWNMVKLAVLILFHSKYVSLGGCLKTWVPFLILYGSIITIFTLMYYL